MRLTCATGVLAAVCVLATAGTASAQFWPGYGHYGDYGGWGAYTSALQNTTSRYVAAADHLAGQRAAMQQSAAMQQGIQNTMTTQAEARSRGIIGQQQSNRDWWFQVQQQQVAQRQAMPSGSAMAAAAAFEPQPRASAPAAATDVIKWLPILCDAEFAAERARVEAPYRRTPKGAPTAEDYRNMIDAAEKMKAILNQLTSQISAQEYLNAEKFLNQLATEARGRIEKDVAPAAKQPK